MFTFLLLIHIISGFLCLVTGLIAMCTKKRKGTHSRSGETYHWSYVIVFLTSITMAILHWNESAYLFYIGIFSYSMALLGYIASKKRSNNWLAIHIGGMLGSYIAIITAVLVVNIAKIPLLNELPVLLVWFLPTIIGTPLIFSIGQKYKPRKKAL
ncbi:DUF2306 domain-containing protein [Bacillus alkalicellulosilyticus]|uniref:DUF2306 domain-containing protein n=1 Tax=Alkalihalobacterium alkalicellulosilyticum TaxID=1912214 RepID=UPI000996BF3A|nr:DUF2306 domain-containing protein [Bacillus alkalicellulosilyticus]